MANYLWEVGRNGTDFPFMRPLDQAVWRGDSRPFRMLPESSSLTFNGLIPMLAECTQISFPDLPSFDCNEVPPRRSSATSFIIKAIAAHPVIGGMCHRSHAAH